MFSKVHCSRRKKKYQKMNERLKTIGKLSGIEKPLHMHLARHTFATTITLSNGVPLETVSNMLGHATLRQTQYYDMAKLKQVYQDRHEAEIKLKE